MASDSKILTVSYGTFSCTLEGFDDPFGTMKAIAEYFRDLAADDRYFGAEPPTPDPDMLARIAERQINGRVEARQNGEGITLRSGRTLAAPEDDEAADAASSAPAAASATPAADSVAARLARIRAAAEARPAPAPAAPATPAPAEPAIDTDAAGIAADATVEPAPEAPADAEMSTEVTVDTAPEATQTPVGRVALEETFGTAEAPAGGSVDAPEPAAIAAGAEAEEETAGELAPGAEAGEEETAQSDAAIEPAPAREEETAQADAAMESMPVAEEDAAQADAAVEPEPAGEEETAQTEAGTEPAPAAGEETAQAEPAAVEPGAPREEDRSARARDAAARARARAMKFGAGAEPDPEPEAPAEADSGTDERPAAAEETARPAAAALSPEAEADLEAELAALENEGGVQSVPETAGDRGAALPAAAAQDEAEVSRLVGEVNTALDAPEQRRRRVSLAHMKAAVAATLAERGGRRRRGAEDEAGEDQEAHPYRADLAEMVAPPSPSRAGAAGARRMPPLMLVSSQRIDAGPAQEADAAPESAGNLALDTSQAGMPASEDAEETGNIFSESEDAATAAEPGESFPDFAARVEASGLDALIEAAGAYAIAIRGQDHFTRPEVMQIVSAHLGGGFPREDALRAFGRMLREGPFERLRRAEFTISGESVYMKKARG